MKIENKYVQELDIDEVEKFKQLKEAEGEIKLKDMPKGWGDCLIETWKEDGDFTEISDIPPEFYHYIDNRGYDNEDCEVMYYESASCLIEEFIDWMKDEDDDYRNFILNGEEYSDCTLEEVEFSEEKLNRILDWALNLKHKVALVAAEH